MGFELKIIAHEIRDGKVVYTISVTNTPNNTSSHTPNTVSYNNSKTYKYRYSQLKDIHEELTSIVNKLQLPVILPEFPGRKLFGATNKSEEAVQERKKELNNYLLGLIIIEKLYNLEVFRNSYLPDVSSEAKRAETGHVNVQMYIDRYTIVEDVVLYYARLRDITTHEEWTFKYRYSDFRNLNDALEKSKIRFLPQFPKRKIFGITNDSPEDIEKRREELERYFNEIFSSKELIGNPVVKYFIEETKKQAEKELSMEKSKKDKKKPNTQA